ncbi:MAG: hypothetical protein Fur0037_26690 [Planctomycetota bacterium]
MRDAGLRALLAGEFRRRLLGECLPRIASCVVRLSEEQIWRKPGPTCNSIGNLLLHLRGNVGQWILSALGGEEDRRDRDSEFASGPDRSSSSEALRDLRSVVERAARVVDSLSVEDLLARRRIQGRFGETGFSAVIHVIEHFSGHAGQIYAWTKQMTGEDLRFYDL